MNETVLKIGTIITAVIVIVSDVLTIINSGKESEISLFEKLMRNSAIAILNLLIFVIIAKIIG